MNSRDDPDVIFDTTENKELPYHIDYIEKDEYRSRAIYDFNKKRAARRIVSPQIYNDDCERISSDLPSIDLHGIKNDSVYFFKNTLPNVADDLASSISVKTTSSGGSLRSLIYLASFGGIIILAVGVGFYLLVLGGIVLSIMYLIRLVL